MSSKIDAALKRIDALEALADLQSEQAEKQLKQAASMREECHKARLLLEAGVSTPAKRRKKTPSVNVSAVVAGRKAFLNKKTRQVATGGH